MSIPIDCPDFEVVVKEDGTRTCVNYKGNYLCSLKKHFVCTPALKFKPPVLPHHRSYNQLSTFAKCRMLYYLNYVLKLDSTRKADYFVQGDIFHKRMKNYYATGSTESISNRDTENDVLAETMADLYCEYYPANEYQGAELENEKKVEIEGREFKFVIDALNGKEIIDHKLSGQVQSFLTTAFQGAIYLLAVPEAEKFTLNTTIKSQVDCSKGLVDYAAKIRASVTKKKQKHFVRLTYYRDEILSIFERQVKNIQFSMDEAAEHLHDMKYYYMNPSACMMIECEKQSICNTGAVSDKLYKVRTKKEDKTKEDRNEPQGQGS